MGTDSQLKSGPVSADEERWLRPSEVAAFFRVSPVTVRSWAKAGLLKAQVTPGGHRRFLLSEVKRFALARC